MNKKDLLKLQKRGEKWVKEAGKILQKYQNKAKIKKRKSDFWDIATDADLKSERFLIKKIHKNFPKHSIFAEECGEELRNSDFTWIIDPLDGTAEYAKGLAFYNILLALEYKKELVLGVVFNPRTNELFATSKGNGAFFNEKRIYVSSEKFLKNSYIWTHLPNYKISKKNADFSWKILKNLTSKIYRLRAFCHDAATLCWTARGAVDAYILTFPRAKWWDFAPGLLMVEEAGGKVTDIFGKKIKNRDLSRGIIASNGKIHKKLLKYFKETKL